MRFWIIIIISIIIFGCNTHSSKSIKESLAEDSVVVQELKTGIINNLNAQTDPSCRYGLYIPKDSLQKYPFILIFDPHASGNYAASQYQELAEKYRIILAASNNIQNGMGSDKFTYYANCIINDVMNLLPIDSEYVYLMGFSGGARVASYLAQSESVFKGLISCGAGIADIASIPISNFLYVGFAGYSDFNFSEVYKSENIIRASNINSNFKYYEGKHEWPPDSVMEYAFAAISLDMLRKPDKTIQKYISSEFENLKTIPIRDAWKKMLSYNSLKDLMENYPGLDNEKNKAFVYLSGYEAKTAEKNLNKSLTAESKYQSEIQNMFIEKDFDWWKKEVQLLKQASDKKDKSPSDYKDIRLLNYISMSCYMVVNSSFNNNDLSQAQKYLTIYNLVDPNNPDVSFFYGVYLAKTDNYSLAIDSLSSAIKKGYTDKSKWLNENAFVPLKDSLRFMDLESKLNSVL